MADLYNLSAGVVQDIQIQGENVNDIWKNQLKDDIQSNLRMREKHCLWGAQTNHIDVNYMKYLSH
jgi:hypothetical protein